MPARLSFALLVIAMHVTVAGMMKPTDEMTPEELERQRLTEGALAVAEEQSLQPRPTRRYAPNGDTVDAQAFLESLGQSTLRCSACELVAVKFEQAIDGELVAGWAANTSAERAEALRTTMPKRACGKMKRMQIAMDGAEDSLKYVDLTHGTEADMVAADFGAMGLQHRETVRTLCSVLAKMDPEPIVSQMEHILQQKPGLRLDQIDLRDAICIELLGECTGKPTLALEPTFTFNKMDPKPEQPKQEL